MLILRFNPSLSTPSFQRTRLLSSLTSAVQIGQVIESLGTTYRIHQLLQDKGTQDKVWLAIDGDNKQNYVVKTFFNSVMNEKHSAMQAFRGKPFIRQQVDEATNPPAVILEYLDEDLLSYSSKRKLDLPDVKAVGHQILQAIQSMHESGYVHTDVKLNNILINHENEASQITEIKLADCETAAFLGTNKFIAERPIGTAIFRSPEAILQRDIGTPTDIWSFGTVLISLLLGPYRHVFRPPPETPDAEWDIVVLQRQDMFFGPFPTKFAKRMGGDVTQLLLSIIVPPHERRAFRNWDPDEIAPADVDL